MKTGAAWDNPQFRKKVFVIGIACLFLIMTVTAVFGKKGVMDIHRSRQMLADLDAKILKLTQEKAKLEAEIQALATNPNAVEKEARRMFWLVKPGEKTIVLPKAPKK